MSRVFCLQDWVTVRGVDQLTVSQDEERWLDLDGFSDATLWIDVAEVTPPGGIASNAVKLAVQTSASADESYFIPLAPVVSYGTTAQWQQPTAAPLVIRSGTSPLTNNLSRYVRWQIVPSGSGPWDIAFRIRVLANRTTAFTPALLPNLQIWFRADLGTTQNSASPYIVTAWNDQSGTGDANKNLTHGSSTAGPLITRSDSQYLGQATMTVGADANDYFANSGQWTNKVNQPHTLVLVGHRTSSPANNTFFIDGNGVDTTTAASVWVDTSSKINMNAGSTLTSSSAVNRQVPSAFLGEFHDTSSKMFFNNFTTPLSVAGSSAGTISFRGMSLGVHSIGFGGLNVWPGKIVEVLDYATILTANQKAQLRNYLNGRYGLTIT